MKKILVLLFGLLSICSYGQTFDLLKEHAFTPGIEGPATDAAGYIYAVNFQREGTIGRVDPQTGTAEIWVDLRQTVSDSATANGLRFLNPKQGDSLLLVADYRGHNLIALDAQTGAVKWIKNAPMSQPNDLAVAPNGTVYLSDPDWAKNRGRVWIYKPKGAEGGAGEITLLIDGLSATNGIEVSPLGDRLYVGLSNERKILSYDIAPDGTVQNRRDFFEFAQGGLDGMRTDVRGNLYATRYDAGAVAVISPQGRVIQTVTLKGKRPSNLTFSEKMVLVTLADRGCFEVFEAPYAGRE